MNSVTPKAAAKQDLSFNEPTSGLDSCSSRCDPIHKNHCHEFGHSYIFNKGQFVKHKLMPSSNFRCDQIHSGHIYDFGHSLLCCPSLTYVFNKPRGQFVEQKLMLSSNFRCGKIHNICCHEFNHIVVLLKSDLDVQQSHLSYPIWKV
jgi:hypothetical protein